MKNWNSALAMLSDSLRVCVLLTDMEGLSYEETAAGARHSHRHGPLPPGPGANEAARFVAGLRQAARLPALDDLILGTTMRT